MHVCRNIWLAITHIHTSSAAGAATRCLLAIFSGSAPPSSRLNGDFQATRKQCRFAPVAHTLQWVTVYIHVRNICLYMHHGPCTNTAGEQSTVPSASTLTPSVTSDEQSQGNVIICNHRSYNDAVCTVYGFLSVCRHQRSL